MDRRSIFVGIDLHKRVSQVTAMGETGELASWRLQNEDLPRWEKVFKPLARNAQVALEATGNWMWLADLLQEMGAEVHLAHPSKVRIIAESRNKNDRVDSEALLMLLKAGLLPEAYLASVEVRQKRQLLRLRQGLVHMRTEVKNRLHALLAQHNIHPKVTDLFGKGGRAFLERVGLPPVSNTCRRVWLEILDALSVQIKRVEDFLYKNLEDEPQAKLLQTMPGVGKLTAYLLLAEIGPIERFSRPDKLVSYAGLCPSTRASADKVYYGRTGPAGREYIKWALVEVAQTAARCDSFFASFYTRMRHRKGNGKAIVAVARKMLEIIWRMMRENRPYIPRPKANNRVGPSAPVAGSRK